MESILILREAETLVMRFFGPSPLMHNHVEDGEPFTLHIPIGEFCTHQCIALKLLLLVLQDPGRSHLKLFAM